MCLCEWMCFVFENNFDDVGADFFNKNVYWEDVVFVICLLWCNADDFEKSMLLFCDFVFHVCTGLYKKKCAVGVVAQCQASVYIDEDLLFEFYFF